MGLFNFLFGSDDSSESSSEQTMYEIHIVGTIQANGPKSINRKIIVDETQRQLFTGSKRKEALEGWVRANYPGVTKVNSLAVVGSKRI